MGDVKKKSTAVPAVKLMAVHVHVENPIHEPIPGAKVELMSLNNFATVPGTTNDQGNVTLRVAVGKYELTVDKAAHSGIPAPVPFAHQIVSIVIDVPAGGLSRVVPLTPNVVFVAVQVVDPLAKGIPGVEVELANLGFIKRNTNPSGIAMFGAQPPGPLDIKARKQDCGPFPAPGGVFTLGEQRVPRSHTTIGQLQTFVIDMATIRGMSLTHTAVNTSFPQRIFKGAAGTTDTDQELVVAVDCPAGGGKHIPVHIDFTFTPAAANAPKAKGGKDNTDKHFSQAGAFAITGGTTTAQLTTDATGNGHIIFNGSVTSGDAFVVRAAINRPPHDPTHTLTGEIRHADDRLEVWKRLDYNNLFRMHTGANMGVDVDTLCVNANIQPAYTPCFTEYHKGAVHDIPFKEFVSNLTMPTAAQLPNNSTVRVRSNGPDTRAVTVRGLAVAADGSTSNGVDTITLNGTTNVTGTVKFQRVDSVAVAADPARTLTIEEGTGAHRGIGAIGPHATTGAFHFLFDTAAAVQTKAQQWCDANEAQGATDATTLATSTGAVGFFLVGAAFDHPKHDGREALGKTTFYAGYPGIHITVDRGDFHPDGKWSDIQGFNQGQMSVIFKNMEAGTRPLIVARHEIGHACDHEDFSARAATPGHPADTAHCDNASCLMFFTGGSTQFCTIDPDHSVKRVKGWSR